MTDLHEGLLKSKEQLARLNCYNFLLYTENVLNVWDCYIQAQQGKNIKQANRHNWVFLKNSKREKVHVYTSGRTMTNCPQVDRW